MLRLIIAAWRWLNPAHAAGDQHDGETDYYAQSRPEMLRYIPDDTERLLDIGCSEGRFGAAVKTALPGCETWGVEPVAGPAKAAASRLDKVIRREVGPDAGLPDAHFDVVTMNDVLEHIPHSEPVLALVRRVLRPGGRLVLSLPNVRYYLNVRNFLIYKDWRYCDFGIMDRTHFRFFTERSIARLLADNGFAVESIEGINAPKLKLHYRLLFALAPGFFRDMRSPQFAVVARIA